MSNYFIFPRLANFIFPALFLLPSARIFVAGQIWSKITSFALTAQAAHDTHALHMESLR